MVNVGLYWGYIGIMEKKMETTVKGLEALGFGVSSYFLQHMLAVHLVRLEQFQEKSACSCQPFD